jgi:hypothetical protein
MTNINRFFKKKPQIFINWYRRWFIRSNLIVFNIYFIYINVTIKITPKEKILQKNLENYS